MIGSMTPCEAGPSSLPSPVPSVAGCGPGRAPTVVGGVETREWPDMTLTEKGSY